MHATLPSFPTRRSSDLDWNFVATQGPLFAIAGVLVAQPGAPARRRLLPAAGVVLCGLAALYSLFAPWYSDRRLQTAYDAVAGVRSEEHTSELQSPDHLV